MDGWEGEVMETIINPNACIYQDGSQPHKHFYYRRLEGKPRYMKVVVSFAGNGPGEVVSAYPTDSGKTGEKLIWPVSSN